MVALLQCGHIGEQHYDAHGEEFCQQCYEEYDAECKRAFEEWDNKKGEIMSNVTTITPATTTIAPETTTPPPASIADRLFSMKPKTKEIEPEEPAIFAAIEHNANGQVCFVLPQDVPLEALRTKKTSENIVYVTVKAEAVDLNIVQTQADGTQRERVLTTVPVEFDLRIKLS